MTKPGTNNNPYSLKELYDKLVDLHSTACSIALEATESECDLVHDAAKITQENLLNSMHTIERFWKVC